MSEKGNSGSSSGIGIVGLLAVAFIVLKLCNVITWPWLWVLAPIWGSAVMVIIIFLGFAAMLGIKPHKKTGDKVAICFVPWDVAETQLAGRKERRVLKWTMNKTVLLF